MSASDAGRDRPRREPVQASWTARAPKREAVQPSLWDRLVNDLPGLTSEIDGLRQRAGRTSWAPSGSIPCLRAVRG